MNWGHNNTVQFPAYVGGYGHVGTLVGTAGYDSHAEEAWSMAQGYGSPNIVIAMIDTGVDYNHIDLAANCVAGYDYGVGDNNPMDDSADPGHGTATAGIAAARANNGIGVTGIAGGCSIMPLKVAAADGSMSYVAVANAVTYAKDNGADVISMSLGGGSSYTALNDALTAAYNAGIPIFVAAGNTASGGTTQATLQYPANQTPVISVGASSPSGQRKSLTSSDEQTWWQPTMAPPPNTDYSDITGPTILPTTAPNNRYEFWFTHSPPHLTWRDALRCSCRRIPL